MQLNHLRSFSFHCHASFFVIKFSFLLVYDYNLPTQQKQKKEEKRRKKERERNLSRIVVSFLSWTCQVMLMQPCLYELHYHIIFLIHEINIWMSSDKCCYIDIYQPCSEYVLLLRFEGCFLGNPKPSKLSSVVRKCVDELFPLI